MNLIELLDETTRRCPQKTALIEGENQISYLALMEKIRLFSRLIQTLQLPAGSRVGLSYPNSVNYVALTFALWRLNLVVVPVPTECTEEESARIAASMQLSLIVSLKRKNDSRELSSEIFTTKLAVSQVDNHGLNIAFIRFTSGTTSVRKGVVLSHETILNRISAANKILRINADDTVMWCLPMSHHFLVTIVLYLSVGATVVLARHVLARPFLEAINRWKGTVLYAAPFQYAMLARDHSEMSIPSVRLAVSTTCALPRDVSENFHQRFGLPLSQALGIIELGLVCVNVDSPVQRWNSVGRPLPECAINIRQPDAEGFGEVAVTGTGFFDAYANPWTPREQLMPDGWFATGDIGRLDAQGFLILAGRKNAVINLAGRKVFPEEIEAVLNRHPAVSESRVFGLPHPHFGEIIEAEIVASETISAALLREFCRAHLSPDKIPGQFHFVSTIPKTAVTGKVLRPAASSVQ
ncbi:MAG: class I adenylate-forming enzyme family protein [Verrucomicrobiota bacterium]